MEIEKMTEIQLDEILNDRWAAHYAASANLHNALREGNEELAAKFRKERGQIDLAIDIIVSEIERRKGHVRCSS